MRKRTLLVMAALLVVAALAVLAAACGSKSSSGSTSTAKTTTVAGNVQVTSDPALYALLPDNVKSAGKINCASDIPYMPWEGYVGNTKQPTGFDYDLSQALGAKLGIPMSFNRLNFASIILSIQAGKNDMVMSDMYDNAERQAVLKFVDYAEDTTSALVLKGNPQAISTQDSMSGKTIACESGTTQQKLLQKLNSQFQAAGKPGITVLQLPDQPAAILQVKSGKAAADLTDHSTAEYNAMQSNGTLEVAVDPTAPNGYEPALVGIGILKSNTQLVTAIQKALQALIDDGSYKKIVDKYGLIPVPSAQVNMGTQPIPTSSASATP
jgi:polar amino acid transport system substrate-binding protein